MIKKFNELNEGKQYFPNYEAIELHYCLQIPDDKKFKTWKWVHIPNLTMAATVGLDVSHYYNPTIYPEYYHEWQKIPVPTFSNEEDATDYMDICNEEDLYFLTREKAALIHFQQEEMKALESWKKNLEKEIKNS